MSGRAARAAKARKIANPYWRFDRTLRKTQVMFAVAFRKMGHTPLFAQLRSMTTDELKRITFPAPHLT